MSDDAEHANQTMTAAEFRQQQAESMSEEAIHKAVVDYADRLAFERPELQLLFHPPNGGKMPRGSAGKLKGMGMRKGVPDLLLPYASQKSKWTDADRYSGLALELKSADGYLRSEQAWWLRQLKKQGWAVAVARSIGGAIHILNSYLDGEHREKDLPLDRAEPPPHAQ
jgi:hypothetical protein